MNELNHLKVLSKSLMIGIGNCGRSDDGLGWAFVETIEKGGDFPGDTLLRYQLQVEDADLISQYDQVIFVDAYQGGLEDGYTFKKCLAAKDFSFTTHRLPPETVLYLCQELYQKNPNAYMLLIDGEKWELEIRLSELGQKNLQKALNFFEEEIIFKAAVLK
ncbi:MAG: hydrogenase maturation protease [Bacteroidetes bacterium]|jgi:hydrogenase maturation protease|nr:hydrogenase maturation protease [Bacteroidota bacterium]MDF1866094.1 hydrogenase maturation protease [Saprospiraceae bacterium]